MENKYSKDFSYGYNKNTNTQPLTPEQIAKLRQDSSAFDMNVSFEDLWKATCPHREKNGQSALIQNIDGSWACTICGKTQLSSVFLKEN